jgi:methylase of polypeptide subunit release factors
MDKNILTKYSSSTIETALVQSFVETNNIEVKKNILIKKILKEKSKDIFDLKNLFLVEFSKKNIVDFVNIFELLVPTSDKKTNGAFFTPQLITDFIVSQTITSPDQTVCDPSCGCGAFLISATAFISNKYRKSIIDTIVENIYGVDIAGYSIRRTKILLSLLALKNGEDVSGIKFNLETGDSLTIDWNKIFSRTITNGFDVVIGNPPYVKFQDLNKKLRETLYKEWRTLKTGNYNLYFAFFELGISILKKDGVLSYITPNNYFTSLAGIELREYLQSKTLIEKVIDFNHLKIFNAQTYTSITFLTNKEKNFFSYERVEKHEILGNLKNLSFSKIYFSDLNNKKWRLLRDSDQQNIKKIENIGRKLGEIANIRVGIATCKDPIYFIDGSNFESKYYKKLYKGKVYKIEKKITQPIVKISDFSVQEELNNNNRRIIFPYKKINGKVEIIKEVDMKRTYPYCYEYLLSAKEELSTRDKGINEYPEWYSYARTQGLNFSGKKLLTPTFSLEPRFLLEKEGNSLFCNGYAIYMKNKVDLFSNIQQKLDLGVLRKILNSQVMNYYIKQTSVSIEGGYPCYQKNFIELLGIPEFTSKELSFLNREQNNKNIDNFLIDKYDIQMQN